MPRLAEAIGPHPKRLKAFFYSLCSGPGGTV